MKKTTVISAFAIALVLISCKKNESKTTSEHSAQADVSFPYKAEDGSRAKATFNDNGKSKTITLESNNNKFVLDFKRKTGDGEFYERNTISAETKGDSLLISQDDQVMHLMREK